MVRKAYKMKLIEGNEKEYQKRHAEIWPEMIKMIKEDGISNYSIFWDRETNYLFSYMEVEDDRSDKAMAANNLRNKWWAYMKDIMVTNADNSPVSIGLEEMFHLG